jgi:SAM-dependent methyltransferase
MIDKPCAEYAARNSSPILEVLEREFASARKVLEIGSGTGQHAVTFGARLPHLSWQTSDLEENHGAIRAWIDGAGLANVHYPLAIDVRAAQVDADCWDGVFSANTAHIMSIEAVRAMFSLVGRALRRNGVFCLYGPFRQGGKFNTTSNAEFNVSLRARDPDMGIRDIEVLDEFGRGTGLRRTRLYAMPANNHLVVWARSGSDAS